jgi:hypothetical protein
MPESPLFCNPLFLPFWCGGSFPRKVVTLKSYQKFAQKMREEGKAEGKAEGMRTRTCEDILEVIATRFNPPAADYRRIEKALTTLDDTERLSALFTHSLQAADLAEFEAAFAR